MEPFCDVENDEKCVKTSPIVNPLAIVGGIVGTVVGCICLLACMCALSDRGGETTTQYSAVVHSAKDSEFGLLDDDADEILAEEQDL